MRLDHHLIYFVNHLFQMIFRALLPYRLIQFLHQCQIYHVVFLLLFLKKHQLLHLLRRLRVALIPIPVVAEPALAAALAPTLYPLIGIPA